MDPAVASVVSANNASTSAAISAAVMKKTMDVVNQQGAAQVQMIQQASPRMDGVGRNVDIKV